MRFVIVFSLLLSLGFSAPVADNEVPDNANEAVGDPATPKSVFTEMNPTGATDMMEPSTVMPTEMPAAKSEENVPAAKVDADETDVKPEEMKPTGEDMKPEVTTEEKPVEEMPKEEKPVEEMPKEEKPVEEMPKEEMPVEEKPKEEMPTEDKVTDESDDKNKGDQPAKGDDEGLEIFIVQPSVFRYPYNPYYYNQYPRIPQYPFGVQFGPQYIPRVPTYSQQIPQNRFVFVPNYGYSRY